MELYWKAIAGAWIGAVLSLSLGKQGRGIEVVLSAAVCCMVAAAAACYIQPVFSFLRELETMTCLESRFFGVLLRAAGISLATRLTGDLCQDAGNAALSKSLQLLGSAAVLYTALPVFDAVLNLLREILP